MRGSKEWNVWPDWLSQALSGLTEQGFLAEGGWSWAFFSRQAGNGQCRVCQDRKPDWAPPPPPPLPPPPVRQPQWPCLHRRTSALQCCCIHRQPCMFPVFIPLSIPSLFTHPPVPYSSWRSLSPSSMMQHITHRSFILKSQEKVWKVFLCVLCCKVKVELELFIDRWRQSDMTVKYA